MRCTCYCRARSNYRRSHVRRGATVVEFAISAPILLLFVFALFEFGRFHMLQHTVENAAYEGARRGIVPGATAPVCNNVARGVLAAGSIQASEVTVEPATIFPDTEMVTVRIVVDISQNAWVSRFFVDRIVEASCTLRREEYAQYVTFEDS